MEIQLKNIPIRDVVEAYINDDEEGVVGFNGLLNIRPKYQREYVYQDKQRDEVINTVKKNFPLNVMYWVENDNNTFEVLDGQQRTISICEYVKGKYSINYQYFHNLTDVEQEQILNYELMVYFCKGNDKEKLDWFKTINIAGVQLSNQELRNAIYTGTWLTEAKKYFSKTGCPAYNMASDYLSGKAIRQEYLETIIRWIASSNKEEIEEYMAKNQHEPNANELWMYFNQVLTWTQTIFPHYRKEMKGIDFGLLYNDYKNEKFDGKAIEKEIVLLMQDEDVTSKKGIYPYIITRNEKHLSIRTFTDKQKREAYENQKGICPKCKAPNNHYELKDMEGDHIIPWSQGGKTISSNLKMLCKDHNRAKSDI